MNDSDVMYVSYSAKRRKYFGQYKGEWLGESSNKDCVAALVSKHLNVSLEALIDMRTAWRKRTHLKHLPPSPAALPVDGYSQHQYVTYDIHHHKWKFSKAGYPSTRWATEAAAVAHACNVIKCTPNELITGRRSDGRHKMLELAKRTRTMTHVMAGVLPADLDDWVSRCAGAEEMFQTERGVIVINALWKTKPARDMLDAAWRQLCQGKLQVDSHTRSSRISRMHKVLCKAAQLLSGQQHDTWSLNCGGFAYASGWLAWLGNKRIITKCAHGKLVLGQLKRTA